MGSGGDAQLDSYHGIENVLASSGADSITGANGLNNVLDGGGGGANTFSGLEGDDTLNGGNDNDLIYGN